MAKQVAKKKTGAKKTTAKKGEADKVKAGKAASGKKPEKKDASGKGVVKNKAEEKKPVRKSATAGKPEKEKKEAEEKKAATAKKSAPAKAGTKSAPAKGAAKPAAAKKPVRPAPPSEDDEELEVPALPGEEPETEEKDLDDDDLDITAVLPEVEAGDDEDIEEDGEDEEILPEVDIDLESEVGGEPFGEKKEGGAVVRKTASAKKPKIIVVPASGPKKQLKLAPGLLMNTSKPPLASLAPKPCSGEDDKKKEYRKLTKKEIGQIKEKLILMREDILEKMRKELADTRQRAGTAPADLIDQAADAYDDDVSFEIASANDEDLEQIEAALERLAEGTYGQCEICNVQISPARLKILPFATRCVSCRGDYEKTRARKEGASWSFFSEGENGESDEGPEEEE